MDVVVPGTSDHALAVGDIVLCRVKGSQYLHFVKALQGDRVQIGNNRGGIDGWIDHFMPAVRIRERANRRA